MTTFTPVTGLLGGALIGLAAGLMLLLAGRISGLSGIAAGLMTTDRQEIIWRAAFIAGLWAGAALFMATGNAISIEPQVPLTIMALGGFLVGIGTRLGSGCTAGHGICGIARLSARSVVATLTFFAAAIVTVYLYRHGIGSP